MDNKLKITLMFKEILKTNDQSFSNDETRSYLTKLTTIAFNHCASNPSYVWAIFEYLKRENFDYSKIKNANLDMLMTRLIKVEKNLTNDVKESLINVIKQNFQNPPSLSSDVG
jgi:hypothetical protein